MLIRKPEVGGKSRRDGSAPITMFSTSLRLTLFAAGIRGLTKRTVLKEPSRAEDFHLCAPKAMREPLESRGSRCSAVAMP